MYRLILLSLMWLAAIAQESAFPFPPSIDCVHEMGLRAQRGQLAVQLFTALNHGDPKVAQEAWEASDDRIEKLAKVLWGNANRETVDGLLDTVAGTRTETLLVCLLGDGETGQKRYREHADGIADFINRERMMPKLPPNPRTGVRRQPAWQIDPLVSVCIEVACHRMRVNLFKYNRPFFDNRLDAFVDAAPIGMDDDRRRLLMHQIESAEEICGRDFIIRLDALMAQAQEVDPWIKLVVNGKAEIAQGWNARGGGWAHTVTEQGWKDFRAHIELARKSLAQAYALRPDLPHASADLITVTMANGGVPSEEEWFVRSLKAQIDFRPAFMAYGQTNLPRWGGRLEVSMALAIACIDCDRGDTELPQRAMDLFFQVFADLKDPLPLYQNPEILDYLEKAAESIQGDERSWLRDYYYRETASCAYRGQQFDRLPRLIGKIQNTDSLLYGMFLLRPDQVLDLVTLLKSPAKKDVVELILTMRGTQDPKTIDGILARLPKEISTGAHPYLQSCRIVADFQRAMRVPETWFDIPLRTDLAAFYTMRGDVVVNGDTMTLTSNQAGYTTYFQGLLPERYELEVETKTADPALNSGLFLHSNPLDFASPGTYFSFRISTKDKAIQAFLGPMMRVTEQTQIPAGGDWNRLQVRCTPNSCDLSVNDRKAFSKSPWPDEFRTPGGLFGVGGYCERFPGMVVHFRKIRIRALPIAIP